MIAGKSAWANRVATGCDGKSRVERVVACSIHPGRAKRIDEAGLPSRQETAMGSRQTTGSSRW
jgi:hypothetical protein